MRREDKTLAIGAILYIGTCLVIYHFLFDTIYENIRHRTVDRHLHCDYCTCYKPIKKRRTTSLEQ